MWVPPSDALRSHDTTAMTSAGKSIDPSTAGLRTACLAWLAPHSATTAALQCSTLHCTLLARYGAGATGGKLRSNVRLSYPTSLNLCLHDRPVLGWALSSPFLLALLRHNCACTAQISSSWRTKLLPLSWTSTPALPMPLPPRFSPPPWLVS